MGRKPAQKSPITRFAYGEVETALAQVFGLGPDAQKGALRARIQHLRRLKLPPQGPGKGSQIEYTQEQVDQWLIALIIENAGVDPKWAVKITKEGWGFISKRIGMARLDNLKPVYETDDVLLIIPCAFISGQLSRAFGPLALDSLRKSEATTHFANSLADEGVEAHVANLSARVRVLDMALAATSTREAASPRRRSSATSGPRARGED